MTLPLLLVYEDEEQYHDHFKREYCGKSIITFDGIRVYFSLSKFSHAFYESSNRDGKKDVFSLVRAQRMDWIKATLTSSQAKKYQGWEKKSRMYDPTSRVSVEYEEFVVVIQIRLKNNRELKADFVTCYQADNSISKIRCSPIWSLNTCRAVLEEKKKGR
jgi:hypothetical protein